MTHDEEAKIFACPQCPKIFATRSNLKRHMENPNIHNIPYVRSRDQKRWKGHSKKVISKEETTERMRKWRAENREKNRQNDLRCRVYRLARQRFGEHDSAAKQAFVRNEIARRLGRRTGAAEPQREDTINAYTATSNAYTANDLPFYSAPERKIELPSIDTMTRQSTSTLPPLSPCLRSQRRTSSSSVSSLGSATSDDMLVLPPMHTFLSYEPASKPSLKFVEPARILDDFVGVVLNYAKEN